MKVAVDLSWTQVRGEAHYQSQQMGIFLQVQTESKVPYFPSTKQTLHSAAESLGRTCEYSKIAVVEFFILISLQKQPTGKPTGKNTTTLMQFLVLLTKMKFRVFSEQES